MMEDEETLRPMPANPAGLRLDQALLDGLSVADLRHRIGELQAEIARAEAAILRKEGARSVADGFFRTP